MHHIIKTSLSAKVRNNSITSPVSAGQREAEVIEIPLGVGEEEGSFHGVRRTWSALMRRRL